MWAYRGVPMKQSSDVTQKLAGYVSVTRSCSTNLMHGSRLAKSLELCSAYLERKWWQHVSIPPPDDSTVESALLESSAPSVPPLSTAHLCTSCEMDIAPLKSSTCELCVRKVTICNKRMKLEISLTLQEKRIKYNWTETFHHQKLETLFTYVFRRFAECTSLYHGSYARQFLKSDTRNGILK